MLIVEMLKNHDNICKTPIKGALQVSNRFLFEGLPIGMKDRDLCEESHPSCAFP